jgi:hypothetical protein
MSCYQVPPADGIGMQEAACCRVLEAALCQETLETLQAKEKKGKREKKKRTW